MSRAARLTVVEESGSVSKRHVEINGKDHAPVQRVCWVQTKGSKRCVGQVFSGFIPDRPRLIDGMVSYKVRNAPGT